MSCVIPARVLRVLRVMRVMYACRECVYYRSIDLVVYEWSGECGVNGEVARGRKK